MALRGIKPTAVQKRIKALFYGPAGVGKTMTSIQFPRPYLIDTERGAENTQYVRALTKSGGAYMFSVDPDEVIQEIRSLISEKHDYQTLIIDPLTILYSDLLDKAADKVGTDFGRHKGPADRTIKQLLALLLRLDMNVVITSHGKTKWERAKDSKGKDTVVEAGETFDCYGKLDYLFDLTLLVGKRGAERTARVVKTRIEGFPEGETFPLSYDEIATRYGREVLERSANPDPLGSPEQLAEMLGLLSERADREELLERWLKKAAVEDPKDMRAVDVAKCIDFLNKKGLVTK